MVFPESFLERLVEPIVAGRAVGTFTKEIMVADPNRRWARAHMVGRQFPPTATFARTSPIAGTISALSSEKPSRAWAASTRSDTAKT
jgi:hypothetical protein